MTNPSTKPRRTDPVRDRFFAPLEIIERISNLLFFLAALLSFWILRFDAKYDPDGYNHVQTAFIAMTLLLFIFGQATKLYFWPRSEKPRRQDFLSYGLGAKLTHIRTTGYYNNKEIDPIRRIGAAVLENTLFTKTIVRKMLIWLRILILGYITVWIIALATRTTDLGWIAVAAQVLFSEQLISRYLRMEWLRTKAENIHDGLITIFRSGSTPAAMEPQVWDAFSEYEAAKTNAGILISERIFSDLNPTLSAEWENIKQSANIL
jgi:hypothetical protein